MSEQITGHDHLQRAFAAMLEKQCTDVGTAARIQSFKMFCNGAVVVMDSLHTDAIEQEKKRHASAISTLTTQRNSYIDAINAAVEIAKMEKLHPASDMAERLVEAAKPQPAPVMKVVEPSEPMSVLDLTRQVEKNSKKTDAELDIPEQFKRAKTS